MLHSVCPTKLWVLQHSFDAFCLVTSWAFCQSHCNAFFLFLFIILPGLTRILWRLDAQSDQELNEETPNGNISHILTVERLLRKELEVDYYTDYGCLFINYTVIRSEFLLLSNGFLIALLLVCCDVAFPHGWPRRKRSKREVQQELLQRSKSWGP